MLPRRRSWIWVVTWPKNLAMGCLRCSDSRSRMRTTRSARRGRRYRSSARLPNSTARIGLETGSAVVDAAGEIYGDVANIAARVQALAEPSAVLVTAGVLRQ